jgi:TonB family protein
VAGSGANVLTIGFAISGTEPRTVLLRGVGPGLAGFGVTGALPNPRLRLFNNAGIEIADNSGWSVSVTPPTVFSAVGAFALPAVSRDAVLFFALPPGTYTAQVSAAAGNGTGPALIEAYEVAGSPVPVLTIQPVTTPPSAPPFDAGVGTPSVGPDAAPQVIFQSRPSYPFELRRASVTGEVLIDFHVKTDGTVANAVALRATDVRLAESALKAVRAWIFRPGRANGRLVITHMQVPIVYAIVEE